MEKAKRTSNVGGGAFGMFGPNRGPLLLLVAGVVKSPRLAVADGRSFSTAVQFPHIKDSVSSGMQIVVGVWERSEEPN